MTKEPPPPVQSVAGLNRSIRDAAGQTALLREIANARRFLEVTVVGFRGTFTSALLSLDSKKKTFNIDALSPVAGNRLIGRSSTVYVRCNLNGIEVSFPSPILRVGEDKNGTFYVLRYPKEINHAQKREHYRIYIGMLQRPAIYLLSADGSEASGEIANISPGGLLAVLPKESHIKPGGANVQGYILFSDGSELPLTLKVTHHHTNPKTGRVKVGLHFIHLSQQQGDTLSRQLALIQRKNMHAQ